MHSVNGASATPIQPATGGPDPAAGLAACRAGRQASLVAGRGRRTPRQPHDGFEGGRATVAGRPPDAPARRGDVRDGQGGRCVQACAVESQGAAGRGPSARLPAEVAVAVQRACELAGNATIVAASRRWRATSAGAAALTGDTAPSASRRLTMPNGSIRPSLARRRGTLGRRRRRKRRCRRAGAPGGGRWSSR